MRTVLAVLILAGSGLAAEPDAARLEELILLAGVGGFGDVGTLASSREVTAPGNTLGCSLKVTWEDRPAEPPWWSIRIGLPDSPERFDTIEADVRVESTDGQAGLSIFLYESDDDRWVAWRSSLGTLEPDRWHHLSIPREAMEMWLLGNHTPQWNRVRGVALELGKGKAVFYVDGLRLLAAKTGEKMELLTTADDGLRPDRLWQETVKPLPPAGTAYFPFDEARLGFEELLATPVRLHELLGSVGVPVSGYSRDLPGNTRYLASHGVPSVYYSSFASSYARFLTRRQAWDVNAQGRSLNWLPVWETGWDGQHSIALAHPAVTAAITHKADALLTAGLGVWMVVDYTFPWWDTLWGYSEAMQAAYRDDLAGRDEGLHLREGDQVQILHFAGYLRAYLGFFPAPADVGIETWDQFVPPQPAGAADMHRQHLALFLYLRSYEWLKLADRVGRHYQAKGGHGLWVVPNPEDSNGSSDYVYMLRSCGVRNLFPEWFGPIGWAAEAGYASLPYLRAQADRSGSRLSIIQETGAGGHSAPYLDWRLGYAGVYALTAAGRLDDIDNDFIDEAPYESMRDPQRNEYQFRRFRDAVAKTLAFRQARQENASRPPTEVLCVAERPPARACGSIFFGLGQAHTLAVGLSRAHLVFDLRDSLELESVLERYRVVAYSPWAPRPGDLLRLHAWLQSTPGRILVTHSFVPTRETTEYWTHDSSARLGRANGGALLGLGRIRETTATSCCVQSAAAPWAPFFPTGQEIALASPLVACDGGEALVTADAGRLVSRVAVGQSQVVFLHYTPSGSPEGQALAVAAMQAVAATAGIAPVCEADADTLVQVFELPGVEGGRSVVLWDAPTMGAWPWRYEPGIAPLRFEAPDVQRRIRLPAAGKAPWLAYDLWTDRAERDTPKDGTVAFGLEGTLAGVWYVGPDTPSFRLALDAVRALRKRMTDLGFLALDR
jgi:hypothetical protein